MSSLIQLMVFFWTAVLSLALQPLPYGVDVSCSPPTCATEADRARLWPFHDPNFFVICQPPQWHLIRRPCLGGTLFHFAQQQCVHPSQWEAPCPPVISLPECPRVVCQSVMDQRKLWPEEDPSFFLQCIPGPTGGMLAVRRECSVGFLFSYSLQLCVDARFWEQDCTFDGVIVIPSTPDDQVGSTTVEMSTTTTNQPITTTTEQLTTTTEQLTTTTEQLTTTTEQLTTTTVQPITRTTAKPSTTTALPNETTTTDPIRGTCPVPVCRFQDPNLYPHTDWTMFYQCVPNEFGQWLPVERDCGDGTFFHGGFQFCVNRWEWEDYCI